MSCILVVDDDGHIREVMRFTLQQAGHQVIEARDGAEAWRRFSEGGIDLCVLDIVMPEADGLDVCRRIRAASRVPIIFVSSRDEELDRVLGLELGADDYLVKPFEFEELLARIRALTKRMSLTVEQSELLRVADLELDLNLKVARRGGKEIALTAKEFDLLEYFMRNARRVISKAELSEKVWGISFDTGTNVVEVYINILRKKIDKDFPIKLLHTRIGLGYFMTDTP